MYFYNIVIMLLFIVTHFLKWTEKDMGAAT